MKSSTSKIAIIGGGPAGISCAIQLKRFGIDCILFEKNRIGGMLHNAHLIENYPGFPGGISGINLAERLVKQATGFNIRIRKAEISSACFHEDHFILKTQQQHYSCERLVIASGTSPVALNNISIAPEAEKFIFRDIYTLKDAANKRVGIIGAGDAAFDYALTLARNNRVVIFNRSRKIKALARLVEQLSKNNSISYVEDAKISEVRIKDNNMLRVLVNSNEHHFDLLVFATGRIPALDFIDASINLMHQELAKEKRLLFIGDVNNHQHRQMAIAAGDGIKCAMQINEAENESN